MRQIMIKSTMLVLLMIFILNSQSFVYAEPQFTIPKIGIDMGPAKNPQDVALTVQILILLTVLSIAPSILIMTTSFTRIIIVLSFFRNALATQQTPSNQILIGLALFLTLFIMTPVSSDINEKAVKPYLNEQIALQQAVDQAIIPLREFMLRQTRQKDLNLFLNMDQQGYEVELEDIKNTVLIPAFMLSELKTAFQIGLLLFIPFLIIDMVVASTLMSMGMMMVPPVMISLPFKILMFVMVDGWNLLVQSLIMGFR